MQLIVDDLVVEYLAFGDQALPVLLVLHGWADRAQSWHSFAQKLSGSYRVIVPSLPGFGGSQAPPSPWGLMDYAKFVQAFADKLVITPHVIIGHSNGGAIAIRGLATGTLHADALVLLASAGIRSTKRGKKNVLRLIAKTGKFVTFALPGATRQRLRRRLYDAAGSDMLVAEHMQGTFKKVVGDDVQLDAARLHLPVLLLYGEQDVATPVVYGEQFRELIDNATLEILPGVGHFVYLDAADRVVQAIEAFLP